MRFLQDFDDQYSVIFRAIYDRVVAIPEQPDGWIECHGYRLARSC